LRIAVRAGRPAAVLLLSLLALTAATALPAADLQGVLELRARGRAERDGSVDLREAVVTFTPAAPAVTRPPAGRFAMKTVKKEFEPRVLVVPAGSTVEFPNQDPILHNVFSVSGRNAFDLGLVGKGPGKAWRFDHAGLVRVFCNVHHAMVAYVMVVDTPFHTRPAADGGFALRGVPDGPGKLVLWHERAEPRTLDLTGPGAAPAKIVLEVSKPRIPPHTNKLGKAYGSTRSYD
jgi:plastocyanin